MRFTAAVSHEGDWQVARWLEVEVASQGHTVEEALANLREALGLYFEDETIPEGLEPPIIATVELSASQDTSGGSAVIGLATGPLPWPYGQPASGRWGGAQASRRPA